MFVTVYAQTEAKAVKIDDYEGTDVIINEICSWNVDMDICPNTWQFDSWAEFYNAGKEAFTMSGLWLSNRADSLKMWHIPAGIDAIPAGGYGVIWFGSSEQSELNCTFDLTPNDSAVLILSNDAGEIIAAKNYPPTFKRSSYALSPWGEGWKYSITPSPGKLNNDLATTALQLDAPEIAQQSCVFSVPFSFDVSVPEGCWMTYTTDGSLPTASDKQVVGDATINVPARSIVYRFRYFSVGDIPSDVVSRSFIYSDGTNYSEIPILSIVADSTFLYSDSIGMMVKGTNGVPGNGLPDTCNWNRDWARPGSFTLISTDNVQEYSADVNIEMSGHHSRRRWPKSLKLKGNKRLSGKKLIYPFFSAKPYICNIAVRLRNGGDDYEARFIDPALHVIAQTAGIDLDLMSYEPVHEFIDDQYIGVLNVREPNNKQYVYANYGWDDDEIDQFEMAQDSGYIQDCGTREAFDTLTELSKTAADAETYSKIEQLVDMDEYVNYIAAETWLANSDFAHNNVKGFRKHDDGKFRFVLQDMDKSFDTEYADTIFKLLWSKEHNYEFEILYPSMTHVVQDIPFISIFHNLLSNDTFRKRFIDTYCLMGGSVYRFARAAEVLDSLRARVESSRNILGESTSPTYEQVREALASWNDRMMTALKNEPTMQLSDAESVRIKLYANVPTARLELDGLNVPTGVFDGTIFLPATIKAVAPAGYDFKGWQDARTGTIFSTEAEIDLPTEKDSVTARFTPSDAQKHLPAVRINEVSAANNIYITAKGKKPGWIELYYCCPVKNVRPKIKADYSHE